MAAADVVVPLHRRLPAVRKILLFAAPFAIPLTAYGVPYFVLNERPVPAVEAAAAPPPDAAVLYARHCLNCHGENGDGNGPARVDPKARYFGFEKFKFGSTGNGVPTDGDLVAVLRRGIPGTAMPSFAQLSDGELAALVTHIRQFTRKGILANFVSKALKDGDDPDYSELLPKVDVLCVPGKPLTVPTEFPPPTPDVLAKGKALFLSDKGACSKCHGPEGKGDGPQVKDLKNDNGTPAKPRDLTQGVFKAGRDPKQVFARVALGIPGTPMPAGGTALTPDELGVLVQYVLSMADLSPTN